MFAQNSSSQEVLINEFMSSNGETLRDENGDSPDWIELFNPGQNEVVLKGYGLSDSRAQPFKWVFKGATIPPGGFLLVFASGKDRQSGSALPTQPGELGGLKCWFSADTIATNDSTQVRAFSGRYAVKRWRNLANGTFPAQQLSDSQQPILSPGSPALNIKPSVKFDGVNDLLVLGSPPAENNFCIFVVFRTSVQHEVDPETAGGVGGVSGQRYLFGAQHGGDFNGGAGLSAGSNGISVYEHGSGYMPALAVYDGPVGPGLVIATVNYEAKRPTLRFQGNMVRQGLTSPRAKVTAPVEIGSGTYGSFAGDIAELIIYARALGESEIRGVEEYLAQKYNIHFPIRIHTNFSIGAEGERLFLTRPDGTNADETASVVIPRDVSYGRKPDGNGSFYYFLEPTPGNPNNTPGSAEHLKPVTFSQFGGFYTSGFDLELTTGSTGAEIRYTLDGSEPKTSSRLYTTPIVVRSRAGTANTISMIPTGGGWQPPSGEVFKTTVVRAKAFKPGALPSRTVTHTYLIYPGQRYTLPVLSISTDPANLFDPNIGMYVPGNSPGGNYFQRGDDWERAAHLELYEPNGALGFSQEIGLKIHGNTSRQFPQKGLGIRARYGNSRNPIRYQLFPDRPQKEFERFILRQSGHDYYLTFMRDAMMQCLVEELGVETQGYRPAILFFNGEYWGIHEIRDQEDKYFIANNGNVDPENIDYLEGYAEALEGDLNHYTDLINFMAQNDLARPENYARVESMVDIDNYLNYKIPETYYYRWDIGNHRLWRPRTPDGRWRWLHFDNDVGWGGFWSVPPAWAFNMLAYNTEPNGPWTHFQPGNDHNGPVITFFLRKLLESPKFKEQFINRFADLLNSTFHPNRVINMINAMSTVLAPEMPEHIRRWRAPGSMTDWRNNVEYLRTYALNRPGYARTHIVQKFALGGTATLGLAVSDPNHGSLRVNSLITSGTKQARWSGVYFKKNPIEISAVPKAGYKFTGWEEIPGNTARDLKITLQENVTLTAMFGPATDLVIASVAFSSNGMVEGIAFGSPGQICVLERSEDLSEWVEVRKISADAVGQVSFVEPAEGRAGYFRLRTP